MKPFSTSIFALLFLFTTPSYCFSQSDFGKITLLFAGDLMQHQAQINAARQSNGKYNYSDCFALVKNEISSADIAIANLEVTLGGKPYTGYPQFSAPDEYAVAIKEAGFDVLLTANNHCLDRRKKGLERTIHVLDSLHIPYAGTYLTPKARTKYYPLLLEKNGFRIILLNYTYGTNGIEVQTPNIVNYIDKEIISEDIKKARSMYPDIIIACMHWGVEYRQRPERQERQLAEWLIEQGVHHVIGSHPHVLQPMELLNNTHSPQKHVVVYSLGNYISNMSALHTDGGAMVKLEFQKIGPQIIRLTNCKYSLVWTSRPSLGKNKNFIIYPAANPPTDINEAERARLNTFLNNSRKLLNSNNIGIEEYLFK